MHTLSHLGTFSVFIVYVLGYGMPDGHTGRLPTLGWNSWNAYHCDIDQIKFLSAANALVDTGLRDAGYNYVNIDDCWSMQDGRADGHLVPNTTRFPYGIKGLADNVHSMGLNIGIYSCASNLTCAKYSASLGYEDIDATDFAAWGVDYFKYDKCNVPSHWADEYLYCATDDRRVNITTNGTCTSKMNQDLAPDVYD
jgi:alpha-galactosidase